MKKAKWLFVGLALTVVLALGTGCTSEAEETSQPGVDTGTGNIFDTLGTLTPSELAAYARSFAPALSQWSGSQQSGIWVTGHGKVSVKPDLALLSLGVETRADTVEIARAEAAAAMTAIIDALMAQGIDDKDIQTRFFNISPEYTYEEVFESGRRYNKRVLTGYSVTNNVIAKVRGLDILGVTIDEVVHAGGDATRIQRIQFTVEDPSVPQTQAREKAVHEALAKAEHFATLTDVERSQLLYITESGGGIPVVRDFALREAALATAPDITTPISAGELEVQVTVQAVFAIATP